MQHQAILCLGPRNDLLLNDPLARVLALVPLQLDDLAVFGVRLYAAVAAEGPLHCLADALEVEVVEALDSGDALAPIALLHTEVDLFAAAPARL